MELIQRGQFVWVDQRKRVHRNLDCLSRLTLLYPPMYAEELPLSVSACVACFPSGALFPPRKGEHEPATASRPRF